MIEPEREMGHFYRAKVRHFYPALIGFDLTIQNISRWLSRGNICCCAKGAESFESGNVTCRQFHSRICGFEWVFNSRLNN